MNNNWEKEFKEFLDTAPTCLPKDTGNFILKRISKDLNPAVWKVFMKILIASTISGAVSLTLCPQFGLGQGVKLMHFFMQFGHAACSVACGVIFLGLGTLLSVLLLRPEELRVLQRTALLQFSSLAMIALGAFICVGAKVILTLAVFWFMGAIIGALLIFKIAYRIKFAELSR